MRGGDPYTHAGQGGVWQMQVQLGWLVGWLCILSSGRILFMARTARGGAESTVIRGRRVG
jgi:hypothetical protein